MIPLGEKSGIDPGLGQHRDEISLPVRARVEVRGSSPRRPVPRRPTLPTLTERCPVFVEVSFPHIGTLTFRDMDMFIVLKCQQHVDEHFER